MASLNQTLAAYIMLETATQFDCLAAASEQTRITSGAA
jgi:hypothetical protein